MFVKSVFLSDSELFAIKIVAIASKILQIKIELPPARPVKNPPITAPIMKKVIIP